MLRTLPSSIPLCRRGAQPGNSNARKHGLYSSLHPNPVTQDFDHLRQLRLLASTASEAIPIDLLERQVQDTFELLIDHFLDTDQQLGPQTTVKLDRFFRTVSVSLRLKRRLKKLRDERDFLPDLAKNALSLCTLEFTDLRISAFACYGANQNPPADPLPDLALARRPSPVLGPPFVPQLLQKNHTITATESPGSWPFSPEDPDFPPLSPAPEPVVPQTTSGTTCDSTFLPSESITETLTPVPSTDNRQLAIGRGGFRAAPPKRSGGGQPPSPTLDARATRARNQRPSTDLALENTDYCLLNTDYFPLTPSQQSFLAPILVSLRAQLADMAIRQREHAYPDLFLLRAILLRLAFHLRWSDLPPEVPIRPCQLLYKQLCTSGRMQLIYHLLYEDLISNGRKNLLEMVDSGAFQYEKGRIYLTANKSVTWESFTGLLLLQRACLNQRRKKRADLNDRHKNGRYEREGSIMRGNHFRRSPSPRPSQCGDAPEAGLISILDCQTTNPILNSKLGFIPGDFPSSSP